jgi:hypothetical protein
VSNLLRMTVPLMAAAALAACSEGPPTPEVQRTAASDVRPADPTANLPSDSGSHTTLPSGAVTGAGHPQGTGVQPDVGAPGGLERRARQEERASMSSGVAAEKRAADGVERSRGDASTPADRFERDPSAPAERLVRQSRG